MSVPITEKTSNRNNSKKQYNKIIDIKGGPLETAWSFWHCKRDKSNTNFESALTRLGVCHTIEEFWGASDLSKDSTLHLFRGSSAPMWENYPNGGTWCLRIKKRCPLLNRMWEDLLIACIGELFEEPDVVGVALKSRPKEDSLFLWNKDVNLRYKLVEKLKTILQLPTNCNGLEYSFNTPRIEDKTKVNPVAESTVV